MKTRKDYYTISEAAEVLGIAVPTMYHWAKTKEKFKTFVNPLTHRLLVPKESVDDHAKYVESLKEWG